MYKCIYVFGPRKRAEGCNCNLDVYFFIFFIFHPIFIIFKYVTLYAYSNSGKNLHKIIALGVNTLLMSICIYALRKGIL